VLKPSDIIQKTVRVNYSAKKMSMQCNFCYKEITDGGYVWLNKQWCGISHVEPQAGAGLPHICNKEQRKPRKALAVGVSVNAEIAKSRKQRGHPLKFRSSFLIESGKFNSLETGGGC
jgi:hypothetical protein